MEIIFLILVFCSSYFLFKTAMSGGRNYKAEWEYYKLLAEQMKNPPPKSEAQKSYEEFMKITHPLYGVFDQSNWAAKKHPHDDLYLKMLTDYKDNTPNPIKPDDERN